MKRKNINIIVDEYAPDEALPQVEAELLDEARNAVSTSYAPYSEFHVGAAVLLANGEVVHGSNQENAAYPSGLCAERVALFSAQTRFPGVPVKALAITATSDHFVTNEPIMPCGACRQVIAEVEKRQQMPIRMVMKGERGIAYGLTGIEQLLPLTFHEEKLKKAKSANHQNNVKTDEK